MLCNQTRARAALPVEGLSRADGPLACAVQSLPPACVSAGGQAWYSIEQEHSRLLMSCRVWHRQWYHPGSVCFAPTSRVQHKLWLSMNAQRAAMDAQSSFHAVSADCRPSHGFSTGSACTLAREHHSSISAPAMLDTRKHACSTAPGMPASKQPVVRSCNSQAAKT